MTDSRKCLIFIFIAVSAGLAGFVPYLEAVVGIVMAGVVALVVMVLLRHSHDLYRDSDFL